MKNRKEEYHDLLKNLPISSPSKEVIAKYCPHLNSAQIDAIFKKVRDEKYVEFAVPAFFIKRCYHVLSYRAACVDDEGKEYPALLDHEFAYRMIDSYADGKEPRTDFLPRGILYEGLYMYEAMKYAEENWGDSLILDDWGCTMKICVQDPTDLDQYQYPKTKMTLYVALKREPNDFIFLDRSRSVSEWQDKEISQLTIDPIIFLEIYGGGGVYGQFNCAHCGGGLSLECCPVCGHTFKYDHLRVSGNPPLSPKMVEYLKSVGHTFGMDPEGALRIEREECERYSGLPQVNA